MMIISLLLFRGRLWSAVVFQETAQKPGFMQSPCSALTASNGIVQLQCGRNVFTETVRKSGFC
jgi:hypothetical protein